MKTREELLEIAKTGKHFCILPWIHFHAWPDKRVMPCCVAESNLPVGEIKSEESIIQMMNSEEYKKMRLAMLNDEPYEACKRCYDIEMLGTWTLRQSQNKTRGEQNIELVLNTNDDGSIDEFKMRYMDIRFSNICNMKCRSCGPSCSSLWAEEKVKFDGLDNLKQYFGTDKIVVNNNEDQSFLTKLLPYLDDVEEVYFAGGEILITQEHYDCLDYWIEKGLNNQVELTYTTNFASLKYKDRDLIELWKKFPKLKIWASLDAEGPLAEVIRKGTDWERIIKNMKKLKEEVPHAEFQITPTISIWNVFQFPKFFDTLIQQGFIDKRTSPRFNLMTHPWYTNVMLLPQFSKDKLIKLYRYYQYKYAFNRDISNGFKMIAFAIESGAPNKDGIREFIKWNDQCDARRNETLLEVSPELKEVYEWAQQDD